MTNITITLVNETKDLLTSIKRNYLAIAVNIFKIKQSKEWEESEWVDFYEQELELSKSAVSKLLKVGDFCIAQGFVHETLPEVGYEKLYLSINRNKDKDPEYIISEAATWSPKDYVDSAREECSHNYPKVLVCSHCWRRMSE